MQADCRFAVSRLVRIRIGQRPAFPDRFANLGKQFVVVVAFSRSSELLVETSHS